MYHRPKFDLGTLLVVLSVFIGLLVSGTLLGSCTTAKPAPTTSTRYVVERDARTKHAEPYPSRVR